MSIWLNNLIRRRQRMSSIIHDGEAAEPMTAAKAAEMQKDYSRSNSFASTILEEYKKQHQAYFDDMIQRQKEGAKIFAEGMDKATKEISKKGLGSCNRVTTSSFSSILKEMQELYIRKNHDYGNSFSETIQEFGFTPAIARINDKLKRVKQMVKGEQMQVNESMRDNLIDIANYCILTIIEIDKLS